VQTEVVDAAAQSSRRFLGICLVRELINQNSEWLQQPSVITERLLSFWTSESYQQFHQNTVPLPYSQITAYNNINIYNYTTVNLAKLLQFGCNTGRHRLSDVAGTEHSCRFAVDLLQVSG
jgi:hypothetical protein